MLLALINVLIVIVIGAICFYLIDRFVRDGGNLLKILCGLVLPCRNTATATADTRRELLGTCQQLAKLVALLCRHPNFASGWQSRAPDHKMSCSVRNALWFTRLDSVAGQP